MKAQNCKLWNRTHIFQRILSFLDIIFQFLGCLRGVGRWEKGAKKPRSRKVAEQAKKGRQISKTRWKLSKTETSFSFGEISGVFSSVCNSPSLLSFITCRLLVTGAALAWAMPSLKKRRTLGNSVKGGMSWKFDNGYQKIMVLVKAISYSGYFWGSNLY